MKKSTLLKNASLIMEDASIIAGQDVLIKNGKICKISSSGQIREAADEVIDCSGYFVSCGLANLHVHTAMNIFKGIAEDVTSDQWFNEMIFPYESRMTGEDVYLGTKLGIAEMIDNGVTVFADHYFMEEEVLRAVKDTGMRADLAPTIFGASPDYKERLETVKAFIGAHRAESELVDFHMGPHADYTCPPEAIGDIVNAAKSMDLPIHLHVAEEEAQITLAAQRYGMTPFAYLDRYGTFDCPVLVAHGLWVSKADLEYLRDDTWFAFCPKTYMKLGSGRGGFFDVNDRLHYGFGTDGAASSNTVNVIEQARMFGLLTKFMELDGRVKPAKEIWTHLMQGHRAFSFGTGRMQTGAPADLVIWDLNTPDTCLYYNPVSAILYSSNSRNVRYTMVNGTFLKYDGKLVMDYDTLLAEAKEAQRALIGRGKGTANVSYLR